MRAKENNMAAVSLRQSAPGTECEVLWFLLVGARYWHCAECLTLRTCFLVAAVIEEVVSWFWEEPVIAELSNFNWTSS